MLEKKMEKIDLSDEQIGALAKLGVDLKGKELGVGLLAGRIPYIKEFGKAEALEDIVICYTAC